jgi:hypothetical protein
VVKPPVKLMGKQKRQPSRLSLMSQRMDLSVKSKASEISSPFMTFSFDNSALEVAKKSRLLNPVSNGDYHEKYQHVVAREYLLGSVSTQIINVCLGMLRLRL